MDIQCGQKILSMNQLDLQLMRTCETVTPSLLELGVPQLGGNQMTMKYALRIHQQTVL